MARLSRIFVCFALLLPTTEAFGGIGSLRQRWPQGRQISVCFFGGSPEVRSAIANVAQEWIDQVSISFNFGSPPNLTDCNDKRPYDVRIGFRERGNWSYVGTDALKVSANLPTMNFEATGQTGVPNRKEILEEFGHALGILHQEQDPAADCRAEVNFDYFRNLGFSNSELDQRLFPPLVGGTVADNGEYISTGLDIRSVMRLFIRPEGLKNGEKSKCYGPPTDTLSAGDLNLIRRLYPSKPSDVSSTDPSQLTVRFEGALAAEHFGYVLSALYRDGRVAIRQHVSRKSETIGDVIADERLAPRGVTAPSLEQFLCQINTHVCTQTKGISVWTNTEATKNYVDQGVACGDKSLPKYVLCIPNIRLEPYDSVTTIAYDGRQGKTIKEIVDRLGGCSSWDDACRDLVRRLNGIYEEKFLPSADMLPKSFSGDLRLPSRNYRLVIEYANPDDKRSIEKVVADAIGARVTQLGVGRDSIAIEITQPIGNPRLQQVSAICTSPTYAEPLVTMGNPYAGADSAALLAGVLPVDIGIWDTHVDGTHCAFGGGRPAETIFPTYVAGPTGGVAEPAPPDRSASCGVTRAATYHFHPRYDHATAVAGIFVGNGYGVSGVNSKLRVWAYELLDGNQINRSDPIRETIAGPNRIDPKVINISQTFAVNTDATKSDLESLLIGRTEQGYHRSIVFVAAAGLDEGTSVGRQIDNVSSSSCRAYPACWSNSGDKARGIISVVALNNPGNDLLKDPSGQPLSNFGFAFDVSAVGHATSTYYGNYVGPVCGSSFATPYVSGLAALIFGKAKSTGLPWPKPGEVKERILFTADRLPSVSESRFGRVNYARALDFQDDWIAENTSVSCPGGCPKRVVIDRRKDESIKVTFGMQDGNVDIPDLDIPFRRVKRLTSEGEGLFTVRYLDSAGKLHILERAQVRMVNKLKIVSVGAQSLVLDLSTLGDFVSCSFSANCGSSQ